jgi:hypothetical protein
MTTTALTIGSPFLVESDTNQTILAAHTIALLDGGFVVLWTSRHYATPWFSDGDVVFGQRFAADGSAIGSRFDVANGAITAYADGVGLADGGFVIATPTALHVYGADGNLRRTPIALTGVSAVTALADGGFLVAHGRNDYPATNVYTQAFTADGAARGDSVRVNATILDESYPSSNHGAAIAGLGNGGHVVTWYLQGRIFAQLFDASGVRVGPQFEVAHSVGPPSMAALAGGGFVISWPTQFTGLERAQVYTADGTPIGLPIAISGRVAGALPNGGFYTANGDIQLFNADGSTASARYLPQYSGMSPVGDNTVLADGRILVASAAGHTTQAVFVTPQPNAPSGPDIPLELAVRDRWMLGGESVSLLSLFDVRDTDGDGDVAVRYRFTNATTNSAGVFLVDGASIPAGQTVTLTPAQMLNARFQAGTEASDSLRVEVFDGQQWSAAAQFNMTVVAPVPPHSADYEALLIAENQKLAVGQEVDIAALFNILGTVGRVRIEDRTSDADSGVLKINSVAQPANQVIELALDQLYAVSFENAAMPNTLAISVFNGTYWQSPKTFTVSPGYAPQVQANDRVLPRGTTVSFASLISVTDADNDAITAYRVTMLGNGSTDAQLYSLAQGTALPVGQQVELTANAFRDLQLRTGSRANSFVVSAFDGTEWSAPATFTASPASTFDYSISVNFGANAYAATFTDVVRTTTAAALESWARYLTGSGRIDVRIDLGHFGDPSILATGGFTSLVDAGGIVQRAGTLHELMTGIDPNGTDPDIVITLADDVLLNHHFWFDLSSQTAIPSTFYDALTVLAHEIGHGLGFVGLIDTLADQAGSAPRTTFDSNVSFDGGIPHFIGITASTVHGGMIELADRDVSHLANVADLMSATLAPGQRKTVSLLDAAMLHDANAPLVPHLLAPIATPTIHLATLGSNRSIHAGALFTYSDFDGDTATMFEFRDNTPGGGYWSLNGVAQAAVFQIDALSLSNVAFTTGDRSSDEVGVRVYDGVNWSNLATFTIASNYAPEVTAANVTLPRNRAVAATGLFNFADGDGDALMFTVNNVTGNTDAGYWMVDGEQLMGEFVIAQGNLHRLSYQVGSTGTNTLSVRATDGRYQSALTSFQVSAPPNSAPTVAAQSWSPGRNQVIAAASMFAFADGDSDSLMFAVNNVTADTRAGYWMVDGERLMGEFIIAQGNLHRLSYQVGGTGTNTLSIRATDGMTWSGLTSFQVSAPANNAPTVTALNGTFVRNQVVAPASLFSFADADNDALMFTVNNVTADTRAGYWMVDGERLMGEFVISQANLRRLSYQVGGTGTNTLSIRATDGMSWSNPTTFQVSAPPNNAPTVSATNVTLARNQVFAATSLFSFADADNDALMFTVNNVTADTRAGFWMVDGERLMGEFVIAQGNLYRLSYQVGSSGANTLSIRATDGIATGGTATFQVTMPANNAPTVSAMNLALNLGTVVAATDMFSFADTDGDGLMFAISNTTGDVNAGYWMVDGERLMGEFVISQANLRRLSYQVGSAGANTLSIRATDGMDWSGLTNFNVVANAGSAPVVTGRANFIDADNEVHAYTLFNASDADGDAIATYQFRDNSPNIGTGFFLVNGVPKAPNRMLDIAAGNLGGVTYQAGAGADNLGIRARDVDGNWGAWQSTYVNDPTASFGSSIDIIVNLPGRIWPPTANTPPTVTANDALWQPRNVNRSLLDLLSMYDYDSGYSEVGNQGPMLVNGIWISGQIQSLEFRDDIGESGTGYFVLNGQAQSGTTIAVSAADYNAGNFAFRVGAPSLDHLQVRVSDGIDWSEWDDFTISSTNTRPTVMQAGSWTGVGAGQAAAVAPMFSVTDPDGDNPTRYQFVDGTLGGGQFQVGGVAQAADQIINVLAGQLASTSFQASNAAGSSDAVFVRAFDGVAWSAWKSWNIVAQA